MILTFPIKALRNFHRSFLLLLFDFPQTSTYFFRCLYVSWVKSPVPKKQAQKEHKESIVDLDPLKAFQLKIFVLSRLKIG